MTKKIAIQIADKKAQELHYDIKEMEVRIDDKNTEWNNYISVSKIKEWQPEVLAPLVGQEYWAVYYRPKKTQMGGDLWVFVDKETGKVITAIQGE